MMADSEIERIISLTRYTNYAALLPVLLYLPIGLLLGLIRLCICIHICLLSYILPSSFPLKRVILRVMLSVTGLPIAVQGALSTDVKKKILVANHVTSLDPYILDFLHPDVLVLESPGSPKSWLESCRTFEIPADKNRQDILSTIKEKVRGSEDTLLFFPEKLKTNGKTSLFKFSHLPFEVDSPIQPITIQAHRFFFDFAVSTYSSSAYEDLIWCLILPITFFKIKYLPVTERKRDETIEEFEHRFQANMAKSLGLTMSCYDHHDVTEYLKKKSTVTQGPSGKHRERLETQTSPDVRIQARATTDASDTEIDEMLRQVKEVLPDTPTEFIISELTVNSSVKSCMSDEEILLSNISVMSYLTCLQRTRDVDITITNILEGKVEYSKPKQVESTSISSPQGISFRASRFETYASARQLSFAERKQEMLEAARLKYRLKHGL